MAMRRLGPRDLARELGRGAVAIMPTDTLPGLHCRADFPRSIERIRAIKGRDAQKPLLLLCATIPDALDLCAALDRSRRDYAAACWPGPFTLVLPAGPAAPAAATGGLGTVAIRVPEPAWLRELVAAAGGPLVSTSVNLAGDEPAADLEAAAEVCGEAVDAVAGPDWPAAEPGEGPSGASTLVDLVPWPPRVLRRGKATPPPPAGP